jgi:hypothetical protein
MNLKKEGRKRLSIYAQPKAISKSKLRRPF